MQTKYIGSEVIQYKNNSPDYARSIFGYILSKTYTAKTASEVEKAERQEKSNTKVFQLLVLEIDGTAASLARVCNCSQDTFMRKPLKPKCFCLR